MEVVLKTSWREESGAWGLCQHTMAQEGLQQCDGSGNGEGLHRRP